MFDIGMSEFMLLLVLTLVIAGPQRIPQIVRHMGIMRRKIGSFISEMSWEMERTVVDSDIDRYNAAQQKQAEDNAAATQESPTEKSTQ